ncbi:MAG: hypothetical protein QOH42_1803 [Blastocatellia bacterium]|jgi:hypothetical protein|nr:hypothetical protein [Blastocatellia bacterium]MDX6306250.1 hypothetical protein [Blastocatellia bacterium]
MEQVISLTFRGDFAARIALLSRPDIQIDEMLLALVDKRADSSASRPSTSLIIARLGRFM